ncbi:MAG: LTA synthase family protein, partial [Clostridia bacterium]|nr:LTA synthase family protein [Clostridia bacterium]
DEDIIKLNNYFAAQSGTNKNEYTGYFKDKNLIVLCAESFSPYFIDREMTPTLYKMVTGGFVFKNYFNSWPNTTTNGEYSLCMGMFPDMSRHKSNGSFKLSAKNYLPYCFGNQFKNIGVNTYAYHNYKSSYYTRKESHPNMGYDVFKTMGNGMKFTTAWPASDLEMMEQSVDDYINEERFHAYYMTFSGHYRYAFDSNPMCARNRSKVKNLKYSNAVKAYISCNLELEYALSYLFERLEEAGKQDDTVIVLASDHYPYGLTSKEYNELAGEEIDTTFGKFRSSFICYNSAMDPIEVETPCCNIDILPTMLNLFGLEYDSRLITGTDVFSNGNHVAILSNKSFITDKVMYDAEKGKTTYLVNENEVPEGYIEALSQVVTNKMSIATTVLNKDYYRFVYENTIGIK